MTLVVEDGTALTTANAYVAVADADAYHAARGNIGWTSSSDMNAKGIAIVRASAYLDATYRGRYPGYRTTGRLQGLEWPRTGAYTFVPEDGRSDAFYYEPSSYGYGLQGYDYIASNVVPREIITATCEGALRELVTPGSLAPDLSREDRLTKLAIGPATFTYADTDPNAVFQAIGMALASLLIPASPFSGRAVRG